MPTIRTPIGADTRAVYDGLAALYLPVAIVVAVLVVAGLVWALRRRPGGPDENVRLELAYASVLVVVAAGLIVATFRATDRENARAASPAEVVTVVAGKWHWRFEVHGKVQDGVLTVPAGVPVEFRATSVDVVHGFWIPDLKFQRQLIPGQTARFRLTFPSPGSVSSGTCSFFCGLDHARMRFTVRVLSREEFEAWAR